MLYPRLGSRADGYRGVIAVQGAADFGFTSAEVRVFGVPSERLGLGGPKVPALINPADCLVGVPMTRMIVDSWTRPGRLTVDGFPDLSDSRWKSAVAPAPPVTGCDAPGLVSQFAPDLTVKPSDRRPGRHRWTRRRATRSIWTFPQSNDPTNPESS